MLHYRSVYSETLELLKMLMQNRRLNQFYLVGGTALALQLGHRISIDLDLFTNEDFNTADVVESLRNDFELQLHSNPTVPVNHQKVYQILYR